VHQIQVGSIYILPIIPTMPSVFCVRLSYLHPVSPHVPSYLFVGDSPSPLLYPLVVIVSCLPLETGRFRHTRRRESLVRNSPRFICHKTMYAFIFLDRGSRPCALRGLRLLNYSMQRICGRRYSRICHIISYKSTSALHYHVLS
jgi:hypothetical protein